MKRIILSMLFCFVLFLNVFAVEETGAVAQEACKDTLNVNFITDQKCDYEVKGFRFNLLYGNAAAVTGLSVGIVNNSRSLMGAEYGLVNFSENDLTGIRSGLVNIGKSVTGVDTAFIVFDEELTGYSVGFVNVTQNIKGLGAGFIMISEDVMGASMGFVNIAEKTTGVQSGFVNVSEDMTGYQSGLVNTAGKMKGLMIGLVNVADELEGINIGTINLIKGGFVKISLFSTVDTLYNFAVKSGREFYGLLGLGYDHRDSSYTEKYKVFTGLGYHAGLDGWFIDYEYVTSFVVSYPEEDLGFLENIKDWEELEQLENLRYETIYEFKVLPGIQVGMVEFFAGPSAKLIKNQDNEYKFRVDGTAGLNLVF